MTIGASVFVPMKYDLGGRVVDETICRAVLEENCDSVVEDKALTRSWNLSYLRRQGVVLRGINDKTIGQPVLAGVPWTVTRTLCVYPWIGVLSVDYWFHSDHEVDLTEFYDDLNEWKNRDYIPYLEAVGELTDSLRSHVNASSEHAEDMHGGMIQRIREGLRRRGALEPRVGSYGFHDFRTCFIVSPDTPQSLVSDLLMLNRDARKPAGSVSKIAGQIPDISAGVVSARSTGWATVISTAAHSEADPRIVSSHAAGSEGQDFSDLLSIFSLIHPEWFMCQLWINVADRFLRHQPHSLARQAAQIRESQRSLARDLADVGDLGLMLKDPELLEVAREFASAFQIVDHEAAANSRLTLLREAADGSATSALLRSIASPLRHLGRWEPRGTHPGPR